MVLSHHAPKIIIALDYSDKNSALSLISKLDPSLCCLKVGKNMFTRFGPNFVRELINLGFKVFLDLKFHDIPNTVADACTASAELGVWMVNIHVQGGVAMMNAARDAINKFSIKKRPLLIGVTVLTSLKESDLKPLGLKESVDDLVLRYAKLAKESGLDGVVCSAKEAAILKAELGKDFLLVTPGIRLQEDSCGDQKRVLTPEAAIAAGADYLVIGRSIISSDDPCKVLRSVNASIFV